MPTKPPKPSTPPAGQLNINRTWLDTLKDKIFNGVPDTVNLKRRATSCTSLIFDISWGIPHPRSFKDILSDEEEIPLPTERPWKVWFADACERS